MMPEEQTQQREGRLSTRSLPHHRVPPQSDRSLEKKQDPPEQGIERFLRIFDLFKPRIVSVIIMVVAVCDYIHSLDVLRFLILMGVAAGYIPLYEAVNLLLGKLGVLPSLSKGGGSKDQGEAD